MLTPHYCKTKNAVFDLASLRVWESLKLWPQHRYMLCLTSSRFMCIGWLTF